MQISSECGKYSAHPEAHLILFSICVKGAIESKLVVLSLIVDVTAGLLRTSMQQVCFMWSSNIYTPLIIPLRCCAGNIELDFVFRSI